MDVVTIEDGLTGGGLRSAAHQASLVAALASSGLFVPINSGETESS
jgi:hypothetical protein